MNINMWLLVLALAGIVGTVVFAKNKGTRMWLTWVFAVAGVIGFLSVAGVTGFGLAGLNSPLNFGGGSTLSVADTGDESTPVSQDLVCPEVSKTVTLSAEDAFTAQATGGTHRYRVNNNPASTVADGGTFTSSPGDKLSILFNNGTDNAYFSDVLNGEVPCYGSAIFSKKLYNNGTLTVDIFNRDGERIDGVLNNQTMGAGDVFSLPIRLTGSYQNGLPYGIVAVIEYNTTDMDDVILDLGGSNTVVATPTWYTSSAVGLVSKAYSVPALLSTGELSGTVTLDADDSTNPGNANTFDANVSIRFYPNNYFVNEKNGGAFEGPAIQDESGGRVLTHTTFSSISID